MAGRARAAHALRENRRALDCGRVVLWTHLGLGDQIAMVPVIEAWLEAGHEVVLPVKSRNAAFVRTALAGLSRLYVEELHEELGATEHHQVQVLAGRFRAPIVQVGHSLLGMAMQAFPEYGLNRQMAACAFLIGHSLTSRNLRERLMEQPQVEGPSSHFAFIDHHPGTIREIPARVLSEIRSRGLSLVENPRDVPLWAVTQMLDTALEVHLVSSAPLCLALTIDCQATARTRYREAGAHGLMNDYPESWIELDLSRGASRVDRGKEFRSALAAMGHGQRARSRLQKIGGLYFAGA